MTMMARLFSLWALKPLAAVSMASPMAVPCTGTDSVEMEFMNIFAGT